MAKEGFLDRAAGEGWPLIRRKNLFAVENPLSGDATACRLAATPVEWGNNHAGMKFGSGKFGSHESDPGNWVQKIGHRQE